MSEDQRHSGFGEQEDDSINIGELVQTLGRHIGLIVQVTLLVTLAATLWVATRTPIYLAEATLLLESDESTGGVLSQLTSLSSDPAAEAEIALILSRSLAKVTSATPAEFRFEGGIFEATEPDLDPVNPSQSSLGSRGQLSAPQMESLGLGTIIEPFDLQPGAGIQRRITGGIGAEHRLRARMEILPGQAARPGSLDLYFPTANSVLIAPHKRFLLPPKLEPGGDDVVEVLFQAGQPFEAHGYRLRLAPFGEYLEQRYRVARISDNDASLRLMESSSAVESGRQTNVVNISVEESSPRRAAEIANALAKNYIRRSAQIGRLKATRTLDFIQRQLEKQLSNLVRAEKALADLQSDKPETISISDSAKSIIDVVTALELDRTQRELARSVIQQAVEHMDAGEFEALARLGKETPNLLALGYIQEIAILEAESMRLERTDSTGYKQLLLTEKLRLRGIIQESELKIRSYEQGLELIRSGDTSGIVPLASLPSNGSVSSDLAPYLVEIAAFDTEIARTAANTLPANPALIALKDGRAKLVESITLQIEGTLTGVRASLKGYQDLAADFSASIEEWSSSERSSIDQSLGGLRKRMRTNLASQIDGLDEQIVSIARKIEQQNTNLGRLPQSQLAMAQATRDRATFAEIVAFLLKSEQEAQITAAATSAGAVLIDPAVPPSRRSFPSTFSFGLLGVFLGLALGCGLALLLNAMRAALHTEAQVEQATGLPVIGSIPDYLRGRTKIKEAKRAERFLPMRDASSGPQAEAYRAIRAALKQAMHGEGALNTLAVTSCLMGEGKTVAISNLAIVFAKSRRNVLLVDCDLRRPQIHKLFHADRSPGFGEVLEMGVDWHECVRPTTIEGLSVIPAGKIASNAGELLANARALEVLEQLKEEYDLVVFDLPPAVVVADVANFAHNLDALLLVYRSGLVPGRLLSRTVNMLKQANVTLMGVIINAVYIGRGSGGYGYGYGYEEDKTS